MDTEPGSPDYAKQEICDAVYALIGTATIDPRLTHAAEKIGGVRMAVSSPPL